MSESQLREAIEGLLDVMEHIEEADIEVPVWIAQKSAVAISKAKAALKGRVT